MKAIIALVVLVPALSFASGKAKNHCTKDGATVSAKNKKACTKAGGTWEAGPAPMAH